MTTAQPTLPIALLLPGQGAQYPGMASGLYGWEPAFTEALDELFGHLGPHGARIRTAWLDGSPAAIDDHWLSQPLLFGIGLAMGRTLQSHGFEVSALLGHSAGAYGAAVLAGVMTLADAAHVLMERVAAFSHAPAGAMYAVAATPEEIAHHLTERVVVAAVNSPGQVMISGPEPEVTDVAEAMKRDGLTVVRAKARRGFHSPYLEPYCARSVPVLARMRLHAPRIPIISAYVPGPLTDDHATDPAFWAMQPARPVLFGPALDALLDRGPHLLVETGPGQRLSTLARRHPEVYSGRSAVLPLLGRRPGPPSADRGNIARALAALGRHSHRIHALHDPTRGDAAA
jgi:acyl transferase domain-containing protein